MYRLKAFSSFIEEALGETSRSRVYRTPALWWLSSISDSIACPALLKRLWSSVCFVPRLEVRMQEAGSLVPYVFCKQTCFSVSGSLLHAADQQVYRRRHVYCVWTTLLLLWKASRRRRAGLIHANAGRLAWHLCSGSEAASNVLLLCFCYSCRVEKLAVVWSSLVQLQRRFMGGKISLLASLPVFSNA